MGKMLKINDPIHGFLLFPEFLTKIVDTKEVQRLMRIRQLSGTNHVFPGANHTRFEHSLGVAALAQRLINNLQNIHGVEFSKDDIHDCIVAALLHDIGHGPYSHNFESILVKNTNQDHEDLTEWIISKSNVGDVLTNLGFNKDYIAKIATGRVYGEKYQKGSIISQIITGAVNVDSMDYLIRDNYHCGTKGRSVDINRLLISIDIFSDSILGVDIRALIALEGFLLSRISSFRTIYFHKTCRAVQLMLARGMQVLIDENNFLDFKNPDDYTQWDDFTLWTEMIRNEKSSPIIEKIRKRELLKVCFESRVQMNQSEIDIELLRLKLSELSNIPQSEIFIDVPSSPNVPYNHINQMRPNEIYSFSRKGSQKIPVQLEDESLFFDHFRGELKIVRVYTWSKFRKALTKATEQYFQNNSY